jgi:hypothetical protein
MIAAAGSPAIVPLVVLLLVLVPAVVTISALVNVLRLPGDATFQSGNKTIWTVAILLTGVFGAILYNLAGKPVPEVLDTDPDTDDQPPIWVFDEEMSLLGIGDFGGFTRDGAAIVEVPMGIFGAAHYAEYSPGDPVSEFVEFVEAPIQTNGVVGRTDHLSKGFNATRSPLQDAPRLPDPSPMKAMKICPDCAEEVRAAARKCRYCSHAFAPTQASVER